MAANQVQIPVIQTPDGNLTQIQQNSNKVLRNIYNQVVSNSGTSSTDVSIKTITVTTTIDGSSNIYLCDSSSAAFTITLPDATTFSGKTIYLKKTDSSFNQITITTPTINAYTTQTIDGNSSVTLATQYEIWEILSDGSNWQVLEHQSSVLWTSYTPGFTGASSNPALGSAGNFYQVGRWRRVTDSIECETAFTWGTSGTAFGSGQYRIGLPTGPVMDTNKIFGAGGGGVNPPWGRGAFWDASAGTGASTLTCGYDKSGTTYVALYQLGGGSSVTPTAPVTFANGDSINFYFKVPISGWYA